MNFVKNAVNIEDVFETYDINYDFDKEFEKNFFQFLKDKHYITTEQKVLIHTKLKEEDISTIEDFMDIMIDGFNCDYSEFSTLKFEEFESILCEYFELHQDFGNSLFDDIANDCDFNWKFLFPLAPIVEYPEPKIQNTECIVELEDIEFFKECLESLENIVSEEDKVAQDIIKSMKKKLKNIK